MNLTKNQKIILFIINKLSGSITKTKLVKLLYLIDLESYKRYGKPVTDLEWFYYNHGPFPTKEFSDGLTALVKDDFIEETVVKSKKTGNNYFLYSSKVKNVEDPFKNEYESFMANRIILEFGSYSLDALLDFVYHSKPFDTTKKKERIDFSKIKLIIDPIASNTELDDLKFE